MDDNIVEHYTNQSAFLVEMSETPSGHLQVTLVEVWAASIRSEATEGHKKQKTASRKPSLKSTALRLQLTAENQREWTIPHSFLSFVNTISLGFFVFSIEFYVVRSCVYIL